MRLTIKYITIIGFFYTMHSTADNPSCCCIQEQSACGCIEKNNEHLQCRCIMQKGFCPCTTQTKKCCPLTIAIPVSAGELIDKIIILEIKSERIQQPEKLIHIRKELAELEEILNALLSNMSVSLAAEIRELKQALKETNSLLWDIENTKRAKESVKTFDQEFIQAARHVYIYNDKRAVIKATINTLCNSDIYEIKQYAQY